MGAGLPCRDGGCGRLELPVLSGGDLGFHVVRGFDGSKRLGHIRGKLRKKVWINQGDIILLSLRDYQDEKGDVILKYSADEARSLKAYGELPESAKINETDTYGHEEGGVDNVEFDEDRDSDSGKEVDIDDI